MQGRWGHRGATSNPATFESAVHRRDGYDEAIQKLAREGRNTPEIYESLVLEDVDAAADLFPPLHEESGAEEGFVRLKISTRLADDVEGPCADTRRL